MLLNTFSPLKTFVRLGHRLRGKPPGIAKTLSQRLAEENAEDPEITKPHDIGFAHLRPSRSEEYRQRLDHLKAQRKNPNLEKLARNRKCE
jgi:large subunit ribosomal protein L38